MNKTDIFKFTDYRTFLRSYAEVQKQKNPSWSFGSWAKRLELGGTSVLTNIVNGKRHPGRQLQDKLVDYFSFTEKEKEYFLDLITLQKLQNRPELRVLVLEKIKSKHPQGSFSQIDDKTFSLIAKWFYPALWESISSQNFNEDPEFLASKLRFKVTPKDVKKAINDLIELGLLARDEQQKLCKTKNIIKTNSEFANEARQRFHQEMLGNALLSLKSISAEKRDITGRFMCIKNHRMAEAKQIIKEFRDKMSELFEEAQQGDDIYYLGVQLFPVTDFNKGIKQ